ncbi:hypothetical protein F5Y10DRAFT_272290 [Nemania abortiva]|nr:hypothetical protein F5Y10DRAFT_272290 [Nemania abortiva]
MEESNEEPTPSQIFDETLSSIREGLIQCRRLLRRLPACDTAWGWTASFNNWEAKMCVFHEGRQSLAYRLMNAPEDDIFDLDLLLLSIKQDLEKVLLQVNGHDYSSFTGDEKAPPPPQRTVRGSIEHNINTLHQIAWSVRQAEVQHRQEQIQLFKTFSQNKQVCQPFEIWARRKLDYMFPNASEVLRERMAVSIGARRAWLLYLESHQKETSTLSKPAPAPQGNKFIEREEKSSLSAIEQGEERTAGLGTIMELGEALPNTTVTKLDPTLFNPGQNKIPCGDSVASVGISTGTFPSVPKLNPGSASLTCPYCSLTFEAEEASAEDRWRNHLMDYHDFEPFFCVSDECTSPFNCADTHTGWLAHMRHTHSQLEGICRYCEKEPFRSSIFPSPVELESHLEIHHQREFPESHRSYVVEHGRICVPFRECPFCGGFPEEIEKDYHSRDRFLARDALAKHVGEHLISVTLILLAPLETEEPGGVLDDAKSEA